MVQSSSQVTKRSAQRNQRDKRGRLRLQLERLEHRNLLAGDFDSPWAWFESFDDVKRIAPSDLGVETRRPADAIGPHDLVASEWNVQLSDEAIDSLESLESIHELLDSGSTDFTLIAGLGSPGAVLLQGRGVSTSDVRQALEVSINVDSFGANTLIEGQAVPNDSDFSAGLLTGLDQVNAATAWDETTGSTSITVGVVDSGIDPTHQDLYLNIWLNQGEIPAAIGAQLVDVDGDGLITFYDLNNLRVTPAGIEVASTGELATQVEMTTATPFDAGVNAAVVVDKNENGRIDAIDLLDDVNWADGRDTDGNSFFDDLFGVNFRSGLDDPFASNRPMDELGHGTHVSGTIGAIGNNGIGVVGLNWQSSLMSLRILDNNNQADASAAIRAVNYAKEMRASLTVDDNGRVLSGANVRVLNNSWGQPGGFDQALETAIGDSGNEGILFVAAAGNGNVLGNGVDNDATPFYPASYELENVIGVSAQSADGSGLATFSNFGANSVDIAAPGVGVRSTLQGSAIGAANGTSMASPHVAGTAALIWGLLPEASVAEVRAAILENAFDVPALQGVVSAGGRLDAAAAINADVFAPAARLIAKEDISSSGGTSTEFTVEYSHRSGIDQGTIGDDDLIVTRQWGPASTIPVTLKPGSVASTAGGVTATYIMDAPGGGRFVSSSPVAIDPIDPNTVTSSVLVQNLSQTVGDFTVSVDIEHTFDGDLVVSLISPSGLRAVLFSAVGGSGDNFTGTTLDESAQESIAAGTAPFTGTFVPQESIAALGADGPNGVWTLEVLDSEFDDGGSLLEWSLNFEGSWDPLDFGDYVISTDAGSVSSTGGQAIESRDAGSFHVRIDDPGVLYVDSLNDTPGSGTLRDAIALANAAAQPRTIILDTGNHKIEIPHAPDPASTFPQPDPAMFCGVAEHTTGWSGESAGDFDITGSITIVGNQSDLSVIDGQQLDRVFKVHPGATLELSRLTVTGGTSPVDQGGGGILSAGNLVLHQTVVEGNVAVGPAAGESIAGGGIAAWGGTTQISHSWIDNNNSDIAGGVYFCGAASGNVARSTVSNNSGGGLHSNSTNDVTVTASTFSANGGGNAIFDNPTRTPGSIDASQVTVAFTSNTQFAVAGSVNVRDSLLTANDTVFDVDITDVTLSNVVDSLTSGSDLIGPLTTFSQVAPVHPLLTGNPAIDDGSVGFVNTIDQLGAERVVPDLGAVESISAFVSGRVFVDLNGNQKADVGEPGFAGVDIALRSLSGMLIDVATSRADDSQTPAFDELGSVEFRELPAGDFRFDITLPPNFAFSIPDIARVKPSSLQPDGASAQASLSEDGRFVAFSSDANNLVPNDNNGFSRDLFVFDRETDSIERVTQRFSIGGDSNGSAGAPFLSANGRFVAYSSAASDLVAVDANGFTDIFVYDRETRTNELISRNTLGIQADSASGSPSISADGKFVAFDSTATNLVAGDTNAVGDIFLYNRELNSIERVTLVGANVEANGSSRTPSVNADGNFVAFSTAATNFAIDDANGFRDIYVSDRSSPGVFERISIGMTGEANGDSTEPKLSGDGRFVTFRSAASNLVPGDDNGIEDIFLFDRDTDTTIRVNGDNANGFSNRASISGDGRFVTFRSNASNVIAGDENQSADIFVYDRTSQQIARVNENAAGEAAEMSSFGSTSPSISADGRFIGFGSDASNLVEGDFNGELNPNNGFDAFIVPNPLIEFGATQSVQVGDLINDLNFGIVPDPGELSGRLFEDSVPNFVFDAGETPLANWTVFLDTDQDRQLDEGEVSVATTADGSYRFTEIPAFQEYSINAVAPPGWEQVAPDQDSGFARRVFLQPGGSITGRDFAFRQVSGTGQSSSSSVSGRIFDDQNANGIFDAGDTPLANTIVYLDQQNFGVRDENEAAVETDANGNYTISDLGSSVVAVSTVLEQTTLHASPLGSDLQLETFPLFSEVTPFGNPQAIATGDFNGDTFPDVAVALGEANQVSIRLNDGQGGFLPTEIDIDLGSSGGGPSALVVGQFDGSGSTDIAVVNNFASNVMILSGFDGTDFVSKVAVQVGQEPLDIAAAQITGDADHQDLVVINKANNTLQVLLNDGSGGFTAQPAIGTGGTFPVAIIAGQFTGDSSTDVAVAHSISSTPSSPFGDVQILAGNGSGGFTLDGEALPVGALPTDLTAADFDGDGQLDLAVSNFSSNSISILTGDAGAFTVQAQTLGTASGAFDIAAADIDNDGDVDVVASNLLDRNISIFRNTTETVGQTTFAPLEAVALGQFGIAQRMPLALANFDQDQSAPGGEGTVDIVAIPRTTDTLHVLTNTLVDGSHRVELTGLNQVTGLDFVVQPATLSPSLDPIADPSPIAENAAGQSLTLTGIMKGRADGPPLQFVVTSSNPSLIPTPTIAHVAGSSVATVSYVPALNVSGQAVITVTLTDAGADQTQGTEDDATAVRSFMVEVLPVNVLPDTTAPAPVISSTVGSPTNLLAFDVVVDFGEVVSGFEASDLSLSSGTAGNVSDRGNGRFVVMVSGLVEGDVTIGMAANAVIDDAGNQSVAANTLSVTISQQAPSTIILQGSGNTFFLGESGSQLDSVQLIDIRGTGDNTLMLDADRIRDVFQNGSIAVLSDAGDQIVFDDGWEFAEAILSDGQLVRRFEQLGASINLTGPDDFTNPISEFDVNASGDVSALDALVIINELAGRQFSNGETNPQGGVRDVSAIDLGGFRFYDVTRDLRITALDALRVINQLARQPSEAEFVVPLADTPSERFASEASAVRRSMIEATKSSLASFGDAQTASNATLSRIELQQADGKPDGRDSDLSADAVDAVINLEF
ncbi:MAG: S8 family serine peptidase [Rubripirellula sp.]